MHTLTLINSTGVKEYRSESPSDLFDKFASAWIACPDETVFGWLDGHAVEGFWESRDYVTFTVDGIRWGALDFAYEG